jgi:hypothetical protein
LEEVREAHRQGHLVISATYTPVLLNTLARKSDDIAHHFWTWVPWFGVMGFVISAFLTGIWSWIAGVFTTGFGIVLVSPYAQRLSKAIVGLTWMPLIGFAFTAPVGAWDIGGFYLGYLFTSTARERFRMLVEEVALRSEIVFCSLYLRKVFIVFDNRTGKFLKKVGFI